ncbi:MAG: carboxylating nicotinate-nucleotide diphosphorylase [Spirochaetia bacterium]
MDTFEEILELALKEDLRTEGDVTSSAIFNENRSIALLKSKDTGILAGLPFFEKVMHRIDPEIQCTFFSKEGAPVAYGDIVAEIAGRTLSILKAERTAINILSFLSGIASKTSLFVSAAKKGGEAVILDTRKTLPGYRGLSKYAVKVAGGKNHRLGLFDMVMIKDNHIDAAGSITQAVDKVRSAWGSKYKIEVECRSLKDVEEALKNGVDIIMLDNMSCKETRAAVQMADGKALCEASGNMDLEKVEKYSSTGVDYISAGSLTHSVTGFDFSLILKKD